MTLRQKTLTYGLVFLVVLALGCRLTSSGGDTKPTAEPAAVVEPAESPESEAGTEEATEEAITTGTAESEPSNEESEPPDREAALAKLRDTMRMVKSATIQIVTDASLTDIEGNVYAQSETGSGFIIDKSGLAVTNNHVVTGGRSWKVYINGDDRPHTARVVGVSECSDLAVIKIDGDDFTALEWYEGDIYPGLPVYAAGYPLGDPEFTLTSGIVSKQEAFGETDWASVDGVIEHDATINPGSSGGPLVTEDGRVVAVNYANFDPNRQGVSIQYRAIVRDEARDIIARLREEEDFEAIGINGQAFLNEEIGISGIWVKSVQSGSPADNARIEGGDLILSLEDQVLAQEGTMREYCDTLRSHKPGAPLDVEVYRLSSGELLEGQLNGRKLEVVGESNSSTPAPDRNDTPEPSPTDEAKPTPTSPPPVATKASDNGLGYFTLWGSNFWGTLGGGAKNGTPSIPIRRRKPLSLPSSKIPIKLKSWSILAMLSRSGRPKMPIRCPMSASRPSRVTETTTIEP